MVNFKDDPNYQNYLRQLENDSGLPSNFLSALANTESSWNPMAKSPKGAMGMYQFMPETWNQYGGGGDPTDPYASAQAAARFTADNMKKFGNDPALLSAAYNAGPGNVNKYGGVPPFAETQDYVKKMNSYLGANTSGASETTLQSTPVQPAAAGKGKLLPLLLRVGLPTLTGAALGANGGGTFNALSGGLMGLTGGALGYLNDQGAKTKAQNAFNLKMAELQPTIFNANTSRMNAQTSKDRLRLDKQRLDNDAAYKRFLMDNGQADNDLNRQKFLEQQNQNRLNADFKNKELKIKSDKVKAAGAEPRTADPFGKFIDDIGFQFGNQPIDSNDPEQVNMFKNFISKSNPELIKDSQWFGFGKSDDDKAKELIDVYNQRVMNKSGGGSQGLDLNMLMQAVDAENKKRQR